MDWFRRQITRALAAVLLVGTPLARAQQAPQSPHIGYVYPAGAKQGATLDVSVGGQYLQGTSAAYLSGDGVRVSVVKYHKQLTQGEVSRLRNKLDEARQRLEEQAKKNVAPGKRPEYLTRERIAREAGVTEEELQAIEEFRKRMADPKRQPNPQIAETVVLQLKLALDARPGERELRLITPTGMSNPVYFHVGQLPEYRETEPNDSAPDPAIGDTLPAVINGQITPGDVDRFFFKARKGTRLVVAASARQLVPYLADAVPGWFQAVLAVYDANGEELAYTDGFGFHHDPILSCEIPKDGQYVVEIHDSLYRGREDFVYRITLGDLPFVTSVFPLGGRAGTRPVVELKGWNLPTDKLKVDAFYDRARPVRSISVRQGKLVSNQVPFAVDMLPECLEQEPNDLPQDAQAVKAPIIVNGRIDRPGDCDLFRFEGRARDTIIAEVFARRLDSPVDSMLKLLDAAGRVLAANDDYEDKASPLSTHHADSRISATLPADGTYYLRLTDTQRKGGPDYAYRLHIGPPRPDFELRVVPSSLSIRPGACAPFTVYALRKDGFSEDILLELENAPPGFKLSGAWVPAGQDKVNLTLTAPATPTDKPVSLQLEGHAVVRRRKLSHLALPAEDMMQAFAYHHLVPVKDWTVAVAGRLWPKLPLEFAPGLALKLPAGGTAVVRATATGRLPLGEIRVELSEPPEGIAVQSVSASGKLVAIQLSADAAKVKPGLKGNLIFHASLERAAGSAGAKPPGAPRPVPLGTLPALPFEIVTPQKQ